MYCIVSSGFLFKIVQKLCNCPHRADDAAHSAYGCSKTACHSVSYWKCIHKASWACMQCLVMW